MSHVDDMQANETALQSPTLVLASGGIDSSYCIARLASERRPFRCLHVDFGQPAAAEEWAALQRIGAVYGAKLDQLRVGHTGHMVAGEIVGRNLFLLSAALLVRRPEERLISIGVHAGTPFFDCSDAFVSQARKLVAECSAGQVQIVTPLLLLTKPEIVQLCKEAGVPIEGTYSCQRGLPEACGSCHSCQDRRALGC